MGVLGLPETVRCGLRTVSRTFVLSHLSSAVLHSFEIAVYPRESLEPKCAIDCRLAVRSSLAHLSSASLSARESVNLFGFLSLNT